MSAPKFPDVPIDGRQRHAHVRQRDGHGVDGAEHVHEPGTEHLIEVTADFEYGPARGTGSAR